MKFDFKNALIGSLVALSVIFIFVAIICLLEHHFFAAGIMAVMSVISTSALLGICND